MKNKLKIIKNYIKDLSEKSKIFIIFGVIILILFFILTITVQSNTKKVEEKQKEAEYVLKLMKQIKETNELVPVSEETIKQEEEKLRRLRLLRRCLRHQMERIENGKMYEIDYCEDLKNLEQFSVLDEGSEDVSFVEKKEVKLTSFFIPQANAKENENIPKVEETKKTVYVKGWDRDDRRQARIQYLYEKSGYDKDVVLTFLGENGTFELKRRSATAGNGYYDYGLCQLNYRRHKAFIDSEDFSDAYKQLDYCLGIRNDAKKKGKIKTTFYAYNVRRKQENRVVFE